MGTSLTGLTPATTYDALIKVGDNGPLTGSLKTISDGLGNDSALSLSTGAATITGTLTTTAKTLAERVQVGTAATLNDPTGVGNTLQFANYSPTVFVTGSADSYIYKNSGAFSGLSAQSLIFQTRSDVTGGGFAFVAGGTPAPIVTMTGSGNVGIGTSSPPSKLTVEGVIRLFDSSLTGSGGVELSSEAGFGFSAQAGKYKFRNANNTATYITLDSDGLKFNGDTAAANALDDYEEGTWTPVFEPSTTAGTYSYIANDGKYTKIGNQVTVQCTLIDITEVSAGSGDWRVVGLPFNIPNNNLNARLSCFVYIRQAASVRNNLIALPVTNTNRVAIQYDNNAASGGSSFTVAADFANGMDIAFTFTYFV